MLGKYSIEDDSIFISQSTQVWGNVEFSSGSSAWFNVVLRSPYEQGQISIGRNSHICDQTRISNSQNSPMRIGNNVYIGSQCSLSDCDIEDGCYIGDRSIIHAGTIIPPGNFIAVNSTVISQTIFQENSFIQGSPASSVGYVTVEMHKEYQEALGKVKKEISLYRENLPQAELRYFLIKFSNFGADTQHLLEMLGRVGAQEFLGYGDFFHYHKLDSNSATMSPIPQQDLVYSLACPSYKLQAVIEALGNSHPPETCPFFTVKPMHFLPMKSDS